MLQPLLDRRDHFRGQHPPEDPRVAVHSRSMPALCPHPNAAVKNVDTQEDQEIELIFRRTNQDSTTVQFYYCTV